MQIAIVLHIAVPVAHTCRSAGTRSRILLRGGYAKGFTLG